MSIYHLIDKSQIANIKEDQVARVMVDMSCTLLHHGHIRIIRQAAKLGEVIIALTTDEEIEAQKGYKPELPFEYRKEILLSIKYVSDVIASKWLIDDQFLNDNNIDILVHGTDNSNQVKASKLILLPRTNNISSTIIRERSYKIHKAKLKQA